MKSHILVVDDDIDLCNMVSEYLSNEFFHVEIANTAKQALNRISRSRPDLILLDIRLPDISGYEVFHTIRKDSWGKKAAITILTASESLDTISKNIDMSLDYILFKPTQSLSNLIEHVKGRLE